MPKINIHAEKRTTLAGQQYEKTNLCIPTIIKIWPHTPLAMTVTFI